jgi:hypothetical protein
MSQRRSSSSSGKGDETSDLLDMKALAARARAQTGSHPVLPQNPAELSGVRPRRDSVIGARLTPPPRATSGQLPNWFWGVLGCLSVLLVGFGALFMLGRSGKLAPYLEDLAPGAAAAPPVAEAAPTPAPEPVAPAPAAAEPEAPAKAAPHEAKVAEPAPVVAAEPAPVASAEAAPSAAAPAPVAAPAHEPAAPKAPAHERAKSHAPKNQAAPAAASDQPQAQSDETSDDAPEAKAPALAKPARAPAAAKPAAADDNGDDDQSVPGQDAVEAALDALSSRVRGCFVKYQIKGTARVRLVATPAGTAQSVNVTGDFEDTPTGMCIEAIISGAKLPTFKGAPVKLSQSYQLR